MGKPEYSAKIKTSVFLKWPIDTVLCRSDMPLGQPEWPSFSLKKVYVGLTGTVCRPESASNDQSGPSVDTTRSSVCLRVSPPVYMEIGKSLRDVSLRWPFADLRRPSVGLRVSLPIRQDPLLAWKVRYLPSGVRCRYKEALFQSERAISRAERAISQFRMALHRSERILCQPQCQDLIFET